MFMYIAEVHGKIKPGISKTVTSRILSYDKGNTNPVIHKLYVANEGFDSHINNLESYVLRELFPFLENPNGNRTPSEYIDPKFTKIDVITLIGTTGYDESEWGFPKERRQHRESDINCAIREFS